MGGPAGCRRSQEEVGIGRQDAGAPRRKWVLAGRMPALPGGRGFGRQDAGAPRGMGFGRQDAGAPRRKWVWAGRMPAVPGGSGFSGKLGTSTNLFGSFNIKQVPHAA